ncbi:MAG: DMT family transporter [Actinomycetota bacterium]|nr:DMT family transporter [Actinomycetota bacterium]
MITVNALIAVLAAVGSALVLAVGTVLQHQAGHGPQELTLRRMWLHPLWVLGAVAGLLAVGLHIVALDHGALSVVQPLLVSGLLFALPLNSVLEHRPIHLADTVAAGAVVLGLATFQLTARPSPGQAVAQLPALAWSTGLTLILVAGGVGAAIRRPSDRASWLGLATGAAYGLMAALLKSTVGAFSEHGAAVLTTWPLYAFVVIGAGAIMLNQIAYNAGPLALSLPLITIVDPVVAVAIGAIAFHETISSHPPAIAGQVAGFAVMCTGIIALSRRAD